MTLNNKFFFSSPVEVVKVTPKNLEEVAEWCGGKVAETESRRVKGRMDPYVWVPTPKGSAISWAFPGMFITRRLAVTEKNELKQTYSVFRKDYITKNFFETVQEAVDQTWERQEREQTKARKKARTITVEVPEGVNMATVADMVDRLVAVDPDVPAAVLFSAKPRAEMGKEKFMAIVDKHLPLDPAVAGLPDSIVEQRETLHEDAVESEAEAG